MKTDREAVGRVTNTVLPMKEWLFYLSRLKKILNEDATGRKRKLRILEVPPVGKGNGNN